jgi:hypothetical protein
MAQHLFDTQQVTTTGVKAPATLTKFPEFGATASVLVAGGTATATVALRAWNISGAKEVLATFVLPVASGTKTGDLFDSLVVAAQWENWDWNVLALGSGATLTLALSGAGV